MTLFQWIDFRMTVRAREREVQRQERAVRIQAHLDKVLNVSRKGEVHAQSRVLSTVATLDDSGTVTTNASPAAPLQAAPSQVLARLPLAA